MATLPQSGGGEGDPTFTLGEVQRALAEEGSKITEIVTGSLLKFAEERKTQELDTQRLSYIQGMCIAQRRIAGPTGGDSNPSNIEGWFEDLELNARRLLHRVAQEDRELTELEAEARDTAALIHVHYQSSYFGIDDELLANSGADQEWLIRTLKEKWLGLYNPDDEQELRHKINEKLAQPSDFHNLFQGDPAEQEAIYIPRIVQLTAKLESTGVELPQLGSDGLYDDERQELEGEW